jgi:hypothetical protein
MMRRFFFTLCCAALFTSCANLQSSVQSLVTGEAEDETYGGRQHFPVSPQRAVEALTVVAPQQGWEVVDTGDEYDTHGQHGKFFRIESDKLTGGKKRMSGVFYEEPKGSYVRISEDNGLPEALVDALVTEMKANKGYAK